MCDEKKYFLNFPCPIGTESREESVSTKFELHTCVILCDTSLLSMLGWCQVQASFWNTIILDIRADTDKALGLISESLCAVRISEGTSALLFSAVMSTDCCCSIKQAKVALFRGHFPFFPIFPSSPFYCEQLLQQVVLSFCWRYTKERSLRLNARHLTYGCTAKVTFALVSALHRKRRKERDTSDILWQKLPN